MTTTSSASAADELRYRLRGGLHEPGDPQYDDTCTLFNAMVTTRPRYVARCAAPDDVITALAFARDQGLRVSVRGGGHAVAGKALVEDGLVLDVRPMDDVVVDAERRVVRVGGGATWAQVDAATQAHGLATTGGRVSSTGVAGLTMGGGSGWLERRYGFAADQLLAAELVLADGTLVRADATQHAELLWAFKGGGGNFGVVTAMELALHPVGPEVFACLVLHPFDDAAAVLRFWRDWAPAAPDEVSLACAVITVPEDPDFPAELHGKPGVLLAGIDCGDLETAEEVFAPVRTFGTPVADLSGAMPYAEFQQALDDPPGYRNWWTAENVSALPDDAVDALVARCTDLPAGPSQLFLVCWGGAVARGHDGAVADRGAQFVVHPLMLWEDAADDARTIAVGRGFREAVTPWSTGGRYLNFVGDEGTARVQAGFTDPARMAAAKQRYDPAHTFSQHQQLG